MMIQEVGNHQLPEIWKQLQKFMNCWPKMAQYPIKKEDEQHMNQKTIHQILHEDLGKRKNCRKSVTHSLADEQKNCQDTTCKTSSRPIWLVHTSSTALLANMSLRCVSTSITQNFKTMEWQTKPSPRCKSYTCKNRGSKQECLWDLEQQSSNSLYMFISHNKTNSLLHQKHQQYTIVNTTIYYCYVLM